MGGSIAYGTTTNTFTLFHHICSLWPGTNEQISPGAVFNDLLFKIAVRGGRLCILVVGF